MAILSEILHEHSDAAADYATARIYVTHPDLQHRFGDKGKRSCRADIALHISFLTGALSSGNSKPFTEYICWLDSVLVARNVPSNSLGESLHWLANYFEHKLCPIDHATVLAIFNDASSALSTARVSTQIPAFMQCLPIPHQATSSLTDKLVAGNVRETHELLHQAYLDGAEYLDITTHLLQPSMYQVGHLWQQNRISVAQEHLATAIVQNELTQAFSIADFSPPNGKRALFACVEGNLHSIGIRMVADSFELAGWEVQQLGANLPITALLSQISAWHPELVGLSVSQAQHLETLRRTIAAIHGEFGEHRPQIMIGGLSTNALSEMWRTLKADSWSPSADLTQIETS
ncbi:B12-binding domain-containing protein [Iodobacter arcticus]|uniref:B12-binding domain-containing protein n=1 Tax=Iodobacter arcticus TaxID=590593 RepID=A0ABW2QY09_9NEIS